MSCECYVGAVKVEYAVSSTVTAVPCAYHSDNAGYYDISGTYVPPGSGHDDRVFGKRKTTHYGTNGNYWVSSDLGTGISTDFGVSCAAEIPDTNYDDNIDYGTDLTPPSRDEFENPVFGSNLLSHAKAQASYGSWQPRLTTAEVYAQPASHAVDFQSANTIFDYGSTEYSILDGPDTISSATVKKIKFRFSLAGPKLPVKVKYDLYSTTDSVNVSSDNEFTLNNSNPSREVELPLTSDKAISIQNIRLFFYPFHI